MANDPGNTLVVVGKKYNPYTGKWEDVYGPAPKGSGSGSGSGNKATPKKAPSSSSSGKGSSSKKSPPKPTTADKKNDHRGSGEDNKEDTIERTREIEYDLEGSATIRPITNLVARHMVDFKGLGINFSGKYFVNSVTHTINRGGYNMQIELLRNNFVWKTSATAPTPTKKVPPKAAPKKRYHIVKKGDTLWAIAKRYYGSGAKYTKIYNANRNIIKDPHWIYPKQKFLIP